MILCQIINPTVDQNSLYIDEMSTPIPDIVLLFDTLSMYSLGWRNNTIFNTIQSYDSMPGSFVRLRGLFLQHHTLQVHFGILI